MRRVVEITVPGLAEVVTDLRAFAELRDPNAGGILARLRYALAEAEGTHSGVQARFHELDTRHAQIRRAMETEKDASEMGKLQGEQAIVLRELSALKPEIRASEKALREARAAFDAQQDRYSRAMERLERFVNPNAEHVNGHSIGEYTRMVNMAIADVEALI